jgi:hypothetical protein
MDCSIVLQSNHAALMQFKDPPKAGDREGRLYIAVNLLFLET